MIAGIVAGLLILATGLYFIPVKTTPIDITMDAAKTNYEGEELGTVPITVHGTLTEYLFRENRLWLEISPVEDLYDIKPSSTDYFGSVKIGQPDQNGFYSLGCTASSTIVGEDSYVVTIFFREDLSQWEFLRSYHIGSNKEFGHEYYSELDFVYRATVEG